MTVYVMRRVLLLIPVGIGISMLVFGLVYFIPGDPVDVVLGADYSPETAELLREQLGLNQPVPLQYLKWLEGIAKGQLGYSIYPFGGVKYDGEPVSKLISQRLPTTIGLTVGTMIFAVIISFPLGMLAAVKQHTLLDSILRILAVLGISMPVFWFGLLLIMFFAVRLGWLPSSGNYREGGIEALVLPITALGISQVALVTRMTRSAVLEVLQQDYIRTAWAKGLRPRAVYFRHTLRNALIPVVTVLGVQFGSLMGGAVLTETVFAMPGLGRLLVESLYRRDYPVIQGCVLVITFFFVISNLVVDVLYSYIDPRVSLS